MSGDTSAKGIETGGNFGSERRRRGIWKNDCKRAWPEAFDQFVVD
jgi:hypothetical protein